MYFIHGQPPSLILTRINQTERITVECKAGPPPPPSKDIAELASSARMIISLLCACTMLSILRLISVLDLMDRLKKIEARIESRVASVRAEAEWQRLSEGVNKLETQMLKFFEK